MQTTIVERIEPAAESVVAVTLRRTDEPLAAWTPGAHVDVVLPNWLTRQYSLCGLPSDPDRYRIAVRHDDLSRGGSEYVSLFLRVGHRLEVSEPRNTFRLDVAAHYLFIAGGIGITAVLPMVRAVSDHPTADAALLYVGRSAASMPFTDEVREACPDRSHVVATDRDGRPDLTELARRLADDTLVYACGPAGLLDACAAAFPADRLHVERFRPVERAFAPNTDFEVVCARSGDRVTVAADETMLHALRRTGHPVASGCHEGVCASCDVAVVEGTPDHRDDIGASPGHMYPCVSRSASRRLVVDV